MSPAFFALAVAAFAIGTTEFVMIGCPGCRARSYGNDTPSGSACDWLCSGRDRWGADGHGLMGLFTLGNLLGGAAPAYEVLLAGRIVTGVAHDCAAGLPREAGQSSRSRSRST
jgi:MFS transporter, DHA1 family, inner membrane transport protein